MNVKIQNYSFVRQSEELFTNYLNYFKMPRCAVIGCKSGNPSTNVRYFRIPTHDDEITKRWVDATTRKIPNVKNARICHKHFTGDDYCLRDVMIKVPFNKRRLKKEAVPTLHLPMKEFQLSSKSNDDWERGEEDAPTEELFSEVERKRLVEQALAEYALKSEELAESYHDYKKLVGTFVEAEPLSLSAECEAFSVDDGTEERKKDQTIVETTKSAEIESIKRAEAIRSLQYQNKKLEWEYQRRLKVLASFTLGINKLKNVFNDRQIEKLRRGTNTIQWHEEDMMGSTMLHHSVGNAVYSELCADGHPLPRSTTVLKWARRRRDNPLTTTIVEYSESSGNESESDLPDCDFLHPADIKRIGPNYHLELTDYMKIKTFEQNRDMIAVTLTERPKVSRHRQSEIAKDNTLKNKTPKEKTMQVFYKCSLCDREFVTRQRLSRHHLVHTGERPHRCTFDGCYRAFALKCNLKVHMKIHYKSPAKLTVNEEEPELISIVKEEIIT